MQIIVLLYMVCTCLILPLKSLVLGQIGMSKQTQIRLLLKESSNQELHCLPFILHLLDILVYEPLHDKTNKMTSAPSEGSDQPGHPRNLIRVFAVCMKKAGVLSFPLSAQ